MSFNFWQYAYGNPVNLTDPSGHDPWYCETAPDKAACFRKWIADHIIPSQIPTATCTPTQTVTPTPWPTGTPTVIPTPTPFDITTMPFPGDPAYNDNNAWLKTAQKYKKIRDWALVNAREDIANSLDPEGYGYMLKDKIMLTLIVTTEFRSREGTTIWSDLLGALYNQYMSTTFCAGNCGSIRKHLILLSTIQGIRTNPVDYMITWYPKDRNHGDELIGGEYSGRQGWVWGNYKVGSPLAEHPDKWPHVNMMGFERPEGDYAGIVVFTQDQDSKCGNYCVGWNQK